MTHGNLEDWHRPCLRNLQRRFIALTEPHLQDLWRLEAAGPGLGQPWGRGRPLEGGLRRSRRALVERLCSLAAAERQPVAVHEPHAEAWTARKVLYGTAWHERHHTRQIERWWTA